MVDCARVESMLQDHRQRTSIYSCTPALRRKTTATCARRAHFVVGRRGKGCEVRLLMESNISLLSVSSDSNTDDSDGTDLDSQSTDRQIPSPCVDQSEVHRTKIIHADPYLLDKHLNGISSTQSTLDETDIDQSVKDLFATNKGADHQHDDTFEPRSIRPPPFSDYIEQHRHANGRRTLKQSPPTSFFGRTCTVHPVILGAQTPSGRSCKEALGLRSPLVFSPFLIEQIRQDIQREPGVRYSEKLHRSLASC